MKNTAITVDLYIDKLPEDRRQAINKLRKVIKRHIPRGFVETINYEMIGYVVPHSMYPQGYHCDPKQPLPFINIASQKNFIALYHMGMYADKGLFDWFTKKYVSDLKTKPDMGKSCIRFKKPEKIPFDLIGELVSKVSVEDWIELYQKSFRK